MKFSKLGGNKRSRKYKGGAGETPLAEYGGNCILFAQVGQMPHDALKSIQSNLEDLNRGSKITATIFFLMENPANFPDHVGRAMQGGGGLTKATNNIYIVNFEYLNPFLIKFNDACKDPSTLSEICTTNNLEPPLNTFNLEYLKNSSYDIPKVLDFLIRIQNPDIPVLRFDSDSILNGTELANIGQLKSVIERNCRIWQTAINKDPDANFVFSSKYSDKKFPGSDQLVDYKNWYSTRPNTALNVYGLKQISIFNEITIDGSQENLLALQNKYEELIPKKDDGTLNRGARTLVELPHGAEYGTNRAQLDSDIFLKCIDVTQMKDYYNNLDQQNYIKLNNLKPHKVVSDSAISGAGQIISSNFCKKYSPFLSAGFGATDVGGVFSKHSSLLDMLEKNTLNPNIMWIDDEITRYWCEKLEGQSLDEDIWDLDATLGAYITKNRDIPNNLFFFTNVVYLPTLLSGIIALKTLKSLNPNLELAEGQARQVATIIYNDLYKMYPTEVENYLPFSAGPLFEMEEARMIEKIQSLVDKAVIFYKYHKLVSGVWSLVVNDNEIQKTFGELKLGELDGSRTWERYDVDGGRRPKQNKKKKTIKKKKSIRRGKKSKRRGRKSKRRGRKSRNIKL
jgi:hypothetical protein